MATVLIPEGVQARAQPRKRLPFGFTSRFCVALALGLLWTIPAWVVPQFTAVMFLWDAALLILWFIDWSRLPATQELSAARRWPDPLTLGHTSSAELYLQNFSTTALTVEAIDQVPLNLCDEPVLRSAHIRANDSAVVSYPVLPRERGDAFMGKLFLRYRSALGLAERWATVPLEQTVCVLPAIMAAKDQALYLIQSRQAQLQMRQRRQPGMGREFESLREYREGDELRDVSWSATARRRQLVSRVYTAERSQTLWLLIDAGRLLGARVQDEQSGLTTSKLDCSVNAALALAQIASQHGDQVGLLVYGRSTQQLIAPGRGASHIRRLVEALARVRTETHEANHNRAVRLLLQRQTRRALTVWLTDFAETAATPDVIEYAAYLGKRHLVLLAAMAQPDLERIALQIPQTEAAMFRHAAAQEVVERRQLLLRNLRQTGVMAIEMDPARLTSAVVNQYLQIKDRNLL